MKCPYCEYSTIVVDVFNDVDCVIRRRKCLKCKKQFNTVEIDQDYYDKLSKKGKTK